MTRLKFILIGLLLALASPAMAQSGCGGQFPPNTVCANATGSQGLPGPVYFPLVPASSVTLYVNHTTGSDTNNNCISSSAPCQHIQYAANQVIASLGRTNASGVFPIISTDCGFTETVSFVGSGLALNGATKVVGNEGSPSSCVWNSGGNTIDKDAFIIPSGFTYRTTGGGLNFWSVSKGGYLSTYDVIFSSAIGGTFIYMQTGGFATIDPGTVQISDAVSACAPNCFSYLVQNNGGQFQFVPGQTVTVPNALTFTAFYQGNGPTAYPFVNTTVAFSGAGSGAGSTGLQFQLLNGAASNFNGTTFPGASTGTTSLGTGTITNDNGPSGTVGEYIQSIVTSGSAVSLTTATSTTITSISLSPGDWDVDTLIQYNPANTTSFTSLSTSLSLVNNTSDITPGRYNNVPQGTIVANGVVTYSAGIPAYRFSLATTTTIYVIADPIFSVSTMTGFGLLRARRVR